MSLSLSENHPLRSRKQVKHFLDHLEIEMGRSLRTLESYAHCLNSVRYHHRLILRGPRISRLDSIARIPAHPKPKRDKAGQYTLKKNTQNHHAVVLRSFLKFLAKQDFAQHCLRKRSRSVARRCGRWTFWNRMKWSA
jgi:site-specific recombinase XerD